MGFKLLKILKRLRWPVVVCIWITLALFASYDNAKQQTLERNYGPIRTHSKLNQSASGTGHQLRVEIGANATKRCCVPYETHDPCHPPVIPKLVHFVWFHQPGRSHLRFHHVISLLSVLKFVRPRKIWFHGDTLPQGKWWDFFIKKTNETSTKTVVIHKAANPPKEIFGHEIKVYEHQTDILRHRVLLEHGGIYADLDVVFVKPIDSLLCHDMVMGEELRNWLTNGVMLARPGAQFLKKWYELYERSFSENTWNWISVVLPGVVWGEHPELIHVEHKTMNHPTWEPSNLKLLYGDAKLYDWSANYCVHLWYRKYDAELDPESIKHWNTTVGEVFRYIYYGQKDLFGGVSQSAPAEHIAVINGKTKELQYV